MKYVPTILAVLAAVVGIVAPSVQQLVAAHPTVALVVASLYSILSHFMPSPVSSSGGAA